MDFEVRHAVVDDGDQLVALWHGFTDYLSTYDDKYSHRETADERWLHYFEDQLIDSKYGTVVVADGEDGLLGALEARVMGNHPIFQLENHGFIHGHFVREAYRGEGVGRALLATAEAWFTEPPREVDFYRVRVMSGDDHAAGVYRQAGFEAVERIFEKDLD